MHYVKFDPTNQLYKSVVGAVEQGKEFSLRLQIADCIAPKKVSIFIYNDDKSVDSEFVLTKDITADGFDNYLISLNLKKGLYWYYFKMEGVPYEQFIGINENQEAQLFYDNVVSWQLSVYEKVYNTPSWLNNGIMYHIMVDRFFGVGKVEPNDDKIMRNWGEQPFFREPDGTVKNRDFFGGNLRGIIQKLPYLKSLNVGTIYLSPIFSAYSNHKYDTEDYEQVDPMFGTNADFVELCKQAKKLNINVILDGVFNHVGVDSKYFNHAKKFGDGGAFHDKNSQYRDWFTFHGKKYDCWWNFPTLPRLNAKSKTLKKYLTDDKNGIVPLWISRGSKGWRLDVVDEIDDEMLDEIVRSAKLEDPDCAIIGEVWEDASHKMAYGVRRRYFEGRQLDSVMNYPLRFAIIEFVRDRNLHALKATVFNILNNYPKHITDNLMNILGTHDTSRAITKLAGIHLDSKEQMSKTSLTEWQYLAGIKLLKLCAVLQYTIFGFPSVYYGDEVGLEGYKDPFCRGCFPWGNENKQLLEFYKLLGEIRNHPALHGGSFEILVAEHSVFAFERKAKNAKKSQNHLIVAVSRSDFPYTIKLPSGTFTDLLTNRQYVEKIELQPDQAVILSK